jgi:hypothetical protein
MIINERKGMDTHTVPVLFIREIPAVSGVNLGLQGRKG